MGYQFNYKPDGAELRRFMKSKRYVRGIRGPVGSGKSVGCCVEAFRMSLAQEPGADGWRRTRGAVIRNTFPELKTTTMKTWLEWFPEETFGKIKWQPPMTHRIRIPELMVDMEVIFLALDREEDVKKLLSLELTWAWVNEAREVPLPVITAAISRVNRYPSMRDGGGGATRPGVIMDTNAPAEDHWWLIMAGEVPVPDWMSEQDRLSMVKPPDWEFFTQPPAMLDERDAQGNLIGYVLNPARENGKFIKEAYYTATIQGQTRDWIRNMVQNMPGRLFKGRPVYASYSETVHRSATPLLPFEGHPIRFGVDFGLTPAAVLGQKVRDRWFILAELVAKDMGTVRFAQRLRELMATRFPGYELVGTGDPAGDQRAQTDEQTPFKIMRAAGFHIQAAWTNDISIRLEAWEAPLKRMVDGLPGMVIDPSCTWVLGGCAGGYAYAEADTPLKNEFSHPADAGQYLMLGGGEGRAAIGQSPGTGKVVQAQTRFSPFTTGRRSSSVGFSGFRRH